MSSTASTDAPQETPVYQLFMLVLCVIALATIIVQSFFPLDG